MEKNLEAGRTYIFDNNWVRTSSPFKGRIEELTEKTVLIRNLNADSVFRVTLNEFNGSYQVIETMLEDDINDIKVTNGGK